MGLDTQILRWDLLEEGTISDSDTVISVKPEVSVYQAKHRNHKWGYAVKLTESSRNISLIGWVATYREANQIAEKVGGQFDYPMFILTEGRKLYMARKSHGVYPYPLMEVEDPDSWVSLTEEFTYKG